MTTTSASGAKQSAERESALTIAGKGSDLMDGSKGGRSPHRLAASRVSRILAKRTKSAETSQPARRVPHSCNVS